MKPTTQKDYRRAWVAYERASGRALAAYTRMLDVYDRLPKAKVQTGAMKNRRAR